MISIHISDTAWGPYDKQHGAIMSMRYFPYFLPFFKGNPLVTSYANFW